MPTEFRNEPMTDFSKEENRKKMLDALKLVEKNFSKEYDIIIGGEHFKTKDKLKSINPSNKSEIVGTFQKGTPELAEKAIETAAKKFESWKFVSAEERANYLFKAAEIMKRRKHELSATMVFEVGKSWPEADGDTAEAIDFLEFYAREALRYGGEQPITKYPGEKNDLQYIPLGVGIVIPPWNFPLAILVGMTSAAFVSGNTVVLKPSSDSPLIGYKFFEILEEAKLPAGVVNFVTGSGGTVGDTLVKNPKTRFIAFTGSKEVGLNINALAAQHQKGQIWIKRVVAEMGGKDTIVVADDCKSIDDAVSGTFSSAFGFQGQKCSACSRVVVDAKIYDEFVKKLVEKTKQTKVGEVKNQSNFMGPVINQNAYDSIMEYIEIGKKEGQLVCGGEPLEGNGFFIKPTIFIDIKPEARISQEEIFGPVLAVIKSKNYDEALLVANNTEYGLTGAVYSASKERLERARKEFHVGNLYLNRKCTGALVGVHPFGGFNMSGTDSKAGGRDYLLLFLQAKAIAEKIG